MWSGLLKTVFPLHSLCPWIFHLQSGTGNPVWIEKLVVPRRQLTVTVLQCSFKSAVCKGTLFVINIFNKTTPLIEVFLHLGVVNKTVNKNLDVASLFYCVTGKSILSFSLQPFHFQSNLLIIKNITEKVHVDPVKISLQKNALHTAFPPVQEDMTFAKIVLNIQTFLFRKKELLD